MKDYGLVSIIVPVYNIEKYIERCIQSLIAQSYPYIEIILVNDGSKDESAQICEKYQRIDKRVILYNKENGGLSDARNYGINVSKGNYTIFVDGDDYVSLNYVEKLVKAIFEKNADVAICSFKVVGDDGQVLSHAILNETGEVITGKELLSLVLTSSGYKYVVAWNKIYKKSLFDNIRFDKGKLYEDEFINFRLFFSCNRVAVEREELYYYIQRQGSITVSNMTPKKISMKREFHTNRMEFYKSKNEEALYKRSVQMYCNWLVETFRKYYNVMTEEQKKTMKIESRNYSKEIFFSKYSSSGERVQNLLMYVNVRLAAKVKSIVKE